MATSNIIFTLGSKLGPGGFASLQAGIGMLSGLASGIINVAKEAEKFSRVYSHLKIDINEADSATKGLIDTMKLMESANKFTQAGMNLTKEQFRDVSVLAAQYAQATGGDVTAAMEKLTKSITTGSTRALKTMGIDLENTEDLLKAQAEALEKVSGKVQGMDVKIQGVSQHMYALNNNWGTFTGLLYDAAGSIDVVEQGFTGINAALASLNTSLSKNVDTGERFVWSWDNIGRAVNQATWSLTKAWYRMLDVNGVMDSYIAKVDAVMAGGTRKVQKLAGVRDIPTPALDVGGPGGGESAEATKKKGGRGGGRGRGGGEVMNFTADENEEFRQGEIDDITGGMGAAERSRAEEEEAMKALGLGGGSDGTNSGDDIQQWTGRAPIDTDGMKEGFELLSEQYDYEQERREETLEFAAEWGDVWEDSFSKVSAGSMVAKATMDALHAAVSASVKAAITGQKGFGEAIRSAVEVLATNVAIESGFMALLEFARGLGAAASYNAPEAALHFTAMAGYIATAAVAGVVAGVAHAAAPSPSSASASAGPGSGYGSGSGSDMGSAPSYGNDRNVNVSITLKDGTSGLFDAMVDENDSASQAGYDSFKKAG